MLTPEYIPLPYRPPTEVTSPAPLEVGAYQPPAPGEAMIPDAPLVIDTEIVMTPTIPWGPGIAISGSLTTIGTGLYTFDGVPEFAGVATLQFGATMGLAGAAGFVAGRVLRKINPEIKPDSVFKSVAAIGAVVGATVATAIHMRHGISVAETVADNSGMVIVGALGGISAGLFFAEYPVERAIESDQSD